jgi:hypothetical protein
LGPAIQETSYTARLCAEAFVLGAIASTAEGELLVGACL